MAQGQPMPMEEKIRLKRRIKELKQQYPYLTMNTIAQRLRYKYVNLQRVIKGVVLEEETQ